MAISATTISENSRGLVFRFTGDGSSTGITITSGQYNNRLQDSGAGTPNTPDTATTVIQDTPTSFAARSQGTGMLTGQGGTALTVSSTVLNAGDTATVTLSAAATNGHVCWGELTYNQPRPSI